MVLHYPNIVLPQNFPTAKRPGERLISSPIFQNLFVSFDQFLTLEDTRISSWAAPSGLNTFTQATAAKRPLLTGNVANGRPAAWFSDARADYLTLTTRPSTGGAFSMAAVFRPATSLTQGVFCSVGAGASKVAIDLTNTNFMGARCGSASIFASAPVGAWSVAILAKNATTFRLRANGVTSVVTAHDNDTSTAPFLLGGQTTTVQPFNGHVALAATFSGDILDAANASTLQALVDYCKANYNLAA